MAVQTQYATGAAAAGWTSDANANGASDNNCAERVIIFSNPDPTEWLTATITNFDLTGFTSLTSLFIGVDIIASVNMGFTVELASDDGSGGGFCVGHTTTGITGSGTCISTAWFSYNETHFTWTRSKLENNTLKIRIRAKSFSADGTIRVDALRMVATWSGVAPSAVTGLAKTSATTSVLNTSWNAHAEATGYKVRYRKHNESTSVSSWTTPIDVGNVTSYGISSLSSGTEWIVSVVGYNSFGDGTWSSNLTQKHTKPAVPSSFAVISYNTQTLRISWVAPTVNTSGSIVYDLDDSADGSAWGSLLNNTSSTQYDHNLGADNTIRYYRTRTQMPYDSEISAWSSTINETTWVIAGNPTVLTVSTGIRTTKPSDPIDSGTPTFWQVWGRPTTVGGVYVNISGDIALGTTTYIDTGVTAGAVAYYKVKFKYSTNNYGTISATGQGATAYNLPNQAIGLVITGQTSTSITFDWTDTTDDGSGIIDYKIGIDINTPPTFEYNKGDAISNATRGSLASGTLYYIRIAGINGMGQGAWSTISQKYTLCAAPIISNIDPLAVLTFTIVWLTTTGVDTWKLERSPDGTTGWTTLVAAQVGSDLDYEDIVPEGGDWFYRLLATNLDGNDGDLSTTVSQTVLETNFAIRDFQILELTPNKIVVRAFLEDNSTQTNTYSRLRNTEGETVVFDLILENGKLGTTVIPFTRVKESYTFGLANSIYNGGSMNMAMIGFTDLKHANIDGILDVTNGDLPFISMLKTSSNLLVGLGANLNTGILHANDDSENKFISKISITDIDNDPDDENFVFSIFARRFLQGDATTALKLYYRGDGLIGGSVISDVLAFRGSANEVINTSSTLTFATLQKGTYSIMLRYRVTASLTNTINIRLEKDGVTLENYSRNNISASDTFSDADTTYHVIEIPFMVDDNTAIYSLVIQNTDVTNAVNTDTILLVPISIIEEGLVDIYLQNYTINNNENVGAI